MAFTIVIGLLFLGVVFFHYLQGFYSATISAILTVIAAVLAFSWHETIVEKFLQGKAANIAHAMVLVVLFAAFYLIFRIIFDKLIPDGITLPNAVDRLGGALMGMVAAAFSVGILAIAAQEMPFGAAVMGYTKYDAADTDAQLSPSGGQRKTGYNYDELHSNNAGQFEEADRKQLFPIFPAGVDEIVVNTVYHLSGSGSMQGSQALADVHPDFLQELFGQRIGIQGGANHVTMNLPVQNEKSIRIDGAFTLKDVKDVPVAGTVAEVHLVDGIAQGVRSSVGVSMPLKVVSPKDYKVQIGANGPTAIYENVKYAAPASPKQMLVVIRISFGVDATDKRDMVRISPGSIRLDAGKSPKRREEFPAGPDGDKEFATTIKPFNYYPIGTLEAGSPLPMLYADKPDDYIFVPMPPTSETRPAIDAVFAVDKDTFLTKDHKIADGVFIEIKRMFREDLGGKPVSLGVPIDPKLSIGSLHQTKWHPIIIGTTGVYPTEPVKSEIAPSAAPTSSAPPTDNAIEGKIADINSGLESFGQRIGGLSPDETGKLTSLENDIAARLRANPDEASSRAFQDDLLRRFRDILPPAKQLKFDDAMKTQLLQVKDLVTSSNLKLIWIGIESYANQHGGMMPPDLGSLVGPSLQPISFLSGNTTTTVPPTLATQSHLLQADWVNRNSDFIYLGAGKRRSTASGSFVLAYCKQGAVKTAFLRDDGGVSAVDILLAGKIIGELKTGQNPPPSLVVNY